MEVDAFVGALVDDAAERGHALAPFAVIRTEAVARTMETPRTANPFTIPIALMAVPPSNMSEMNWGGTSASERQVAST